MPSIIVNDKEYELVVLRITKRDKRGRPINAAIHYPDDNSVPVEEGVSLATAFVSTESIAHAICPPTKKGNDDE